MEVLRKLIKKLNENWYGFFVYLFIFILLFKFVFKYDITNYLIVTFLLLLAYLFKKELVSDIVFGVIAALILYNSMGIVLGTDLPVVAIVSNSMKHVNPEITHYGWLEKNFDYNRSFINSWPFKNGFSAGDLAIIKKEKDYRVGEVIVYTVNTQIAPIIHRIVKINEDETYQTKGDNNPQQLYFEKKVKAEQIKGKVIFIIPKLGYLKLLVVKFFGIA